MASTPKRTAKSPIPRSKSKGIVEKPRPARLSREEAELRMIRAAIDLLLTTPPGDVTVHKIAKTAGVHHDYVARYFGSREELLARAIDHATLEFVVKIAPSNSEQIREKISNNPDAIALYALRSRLIMYLVACGVSPERFRPTQALLTYRTQNLSPRTDLSDRTKRNMVLIGTLLLHGIGTMDEVNDMTEQEKQDLYGFISALGTMSDSVQKSLGWDKPTPKKRK
jgi:AcrR family transcriptional regulator